MSDQNFPGVTAKTVRGGSHLVGHALAFGLMVAARRSIAPRLTPHDEKRCPHKKTRGQSSGLTEARAHGVIQACLTGQLLVLADRAYRGAGATVRTPCYGRDLPEKYAQCNRDHARLRAPGERAFARLKQWRILRRVRCSTNRISRTVAAIHAIETAWQSG